MITIGQLARFAGVSTKAVRVYHDKGLLPEPDRDASGYRRYTARHVVELVRIRTLTEAGVPLARIRELRGSSPEDLERALHRVDLELTTRIRGLHETQRRLRRLAAGEVTLLSPEVETHLARLRDLGFSRRWIALETDLWILTFATHPETALELFRDQTQALTDPELRRLYLDYDHAHDLDPDDARLDALAGRIVAATRRRYGSGDLPGQVTGDEIPALVQEAVNASSPAWKRLDALIRHRLRS